MKENPQTSPSNTFELMQHSGSNLPLTTLPAFSIVLCERMGPPTRSPIEHQANDVAWCLT